MDDYQPRVSAFDAVRRYWWLLIVLGAIGAAAAYFVAREERKPVYTAEARLSVGRIDVSTQAIPGFATASQILADSYSRAIVADEVVDGTAQGAAIPRSQVVDKLTASPIPQSGIVRVEGKAPSGPQAIVLANTGADQLTAYVRTLNKFNPDSKRLLQRYRDASREYSRAVVARGKIKGNKPSVAITQADSRIAAAKLQQQTFASLYQASQVGQAAPNTLQVLAYAGQADSDRTQFLQRAAFGGAVGGLLIALGLAMLLARRRARKRAKIAVPA